MHSVLALEAATRDLDSLSDHLSFVLWLQELEAIKARVREMEEEAEKLKELQNEVEKQMNMSPPPGVSPSRWSQVGFPGELV